MRVLTQIDQQVALKHRKLFPLKDGLISVLFHCLFKDNQEVSKSNADPQQSITIDDFERVVVYYLKRGYTFLTQDQLTSKLNKHGKYCFLTFDDGYYNNALALDILEKYEVPATFYFSTAPIIENKSFWWDVYYRQRRRLGVSIEQIRQEKVQLKTLRHDELEQKFISEFGKNALKPVDDTDRPMTKDELKDFERNPYVNIGNHTHNHLILTNYSHKEIIEDIEFSQTILEETIDKRPNTIAYPNGNINKKILPDLKKSGIHAGVTTIRGINRLPMDDSINDFFFIKRFTPWHHNLNRMLALTETEFHIKKFFKT